MKAPEEILTTRLSLRRPQEADVDSVFQRYASDPEVTRYLAWPTHRSVADTHEFLAQSEAEWARWPASAYLIFSGTDGTLLGSTGLSFESATEAATGYALARDAWGRGYATEALGAMVELAQTLGVERLYAFCHPDHRASWRVLEKCRFAREAVIHRDSGLPNLTDGEPCDLFRYVRRP